MYRVIIKSQDSLSLVMAASAKEASEAAAKAMLAGVEIDVEDATGRVLSEAELADLVRQSRLE